MWICVALVFVQLMKTQALLAQYGAEEVAGTR